jgi:hypothetical protein
MLSPLFSWHALRASVGSTYGRKPKSPARCGPTHRLQRLPQALSRQVRLNVTTPCSQLNGCHPRPVSAHVRRREHAPRLTVGLVAPGLQRAAKLPGAGPFRADLHSLSASAEITPPRWEEVPVAVRCKANRPPRRGWREGRRTSSRQAEDSEGPQTASATGRATTYASVLKTRALTRGADTPRNAQPTLFQDTHGRDSQQGADLSAGESGRTAFAARPRSAATTGATGTGRNAVRRPRCAPRVAPAAHDTSARSLPPGPGGRQCPRRVTGCAASAPRSWCVGRP